MKASATTLWIGQKDLLIHQKRTVTSAEAMKAVLAEAAKRNPEIAARMTTKPQATTSTETHFNIVVNPKAFRVGLRSMKGRVRKRGQTIYTKANFVIFRLCRASVTDFF